jgi:hypothetical protein
VGWGVFYDAMGQGMMSTLDANSPGLSSNFNNPGSVLTAATAPRFTGMFDVPSALIGPAPPGGYPLVAPPVQSGSTPGIDDALRAPYTMNTNVSIGREFRGGLFIEASYVGRQSRHSLMERDIALPANLKDLASGVSYNQAANQLFAMYKAGVPVSQVKPIGYWENLWPGAAGGGLSATQAVYQDFVSENVNPSNFLYDIDVLCAPACSKLGPFAMYNEQILGMAARSSIGWGSYNAMQWTVRKRLGNDLTFDFNYTWSKSEDFASMGEYIVGAGGNNQDMAITAPAKRKAVSDYDVTHLANAYAVWELPFGRGKSHLSGSHGLTQALVGGWQISPSWHQSSGLPASVQQDAWPTSWWSSPFATQVGIVPAPQTTQNAPAVSGKGGPNIFADPRPALAAYDYTMVDAAGQRNGIRGDGAFAINLGVAKRFVMPYNEKHSLQLRWETFNLTNSVRFDVFTASLDISSPSSFGKYTSTLGGPRQMQFALRYEF